MASLTDSEYCYLRALLRVEGIGPVKLRNLLASFHSFQAVWQAPAAILQATEGISAELAKRIIRFADELPAFEQQLDKEQQVLQSIQARVVSYWDAEYPALLKQIYDPPLLLFIRGSLPPAEGVAIVGTRVPTEYGRQVTRKIAQELVQEGIAIYSGLARGIDTIAHQTAVQSGGATVAVLGTGINVTYPPENDKLAQDILASGALLTEYPLDAYPDSGNFPRRNRIISGLSRAVIVVETRLSGGAMITANFAADQNRELYAVPGNITAKQSEGTNYLIKTGGARLLTTIQDVLEDLGLKRGSHQAAAPSAAQLAATLSLFEQQLYRVLSQEPLALDAIAQLSGLSVSDCLVYLLSLEFKGLIRQLPGKMFVLQ